MIKKQLPDNITKSIYITYDQGQNRGQSYVTLTFYFSLLV